MGNVIQHTDYTYSRFSFQEHKDLLPILQEKAKGKTVITFKEFEEKLNTTYHFGNIERLNQLKGKNLMVVGLPNLRQYRTKKA